MSSTRQLTMPLTISTFYKVSWYNNEQTTIIIVNYTPPKSIIFWRTFDVLKYYYNHDLHKIKSSWSVSLNVIF